MVPVPTALPNPFRNIGCRHPAYSITTSNVAMAMSVGLSMAISPIGRPPGPPRRSVALARRTAESTIRGLRVANRSAPQVSHVGS